MRIVSQDGQRFAVIGTGTFVSAVCCEDPDTGEELWALFAGGIGAPDDQPGVFLGEYPSEARAESVLKTLAEGMDSRKVMFMPQDEAKKEKPDPAAKLRREPAE